MILICIMLVYVVVPVEMTEPDTSTGRKCEDVLGTIIPGAERLVLFFGAGNERGF